MLRAAGFETYAAMTMAGARVEAVPADQFNHCVVALREEDGSYRMLDPTWAPWSRPLWSHYEGEQHYVIGSPWGETLMRIPTFTPEENLLTVESEAELHADGSLEGSLRFEGRGSSDSRLRRLPGHQNRHELRRSLESWLGRISPRAQLVEYLFSDHRDFDRDTSLRLVYRVPAYADVLGDERSLRSPALAVLAGNGSLSRLASIPDDEERDQDLFLWSGQLIAIEETLTAPRELRFEPPESVAAESPAASLALEWKEQGRRLVLSGEIRVERRLIAADEFAGLRAAADAFDERAESPLYAVP